MSGSEINLRISSSKTKIAYCRDYRRRYHHEAVKFEFLGFSYQPRAKKGKRDGKSFMAFAAEISPANQTRIRAVIREMMLWNNAQIELQDISNALNSRLRGSI